MNAQGCSHCGMGGLHGELVIIKSFSIPTCFCYYGCQCHIRAQQRHKLAIKYFTQALESNPFLWEALENLSELGKNRMTRLAGCALLLEQVRIKL